MTTAIKTLACFAALLTLAGTAVFHASSATAAVEPAVEAASEAPAAPVEEERVMIALDGVNEATGLPTTWAQADTEEGQMVLKYMIKCALPKGESVVLHDTKMGEHRFEGLLGVAPEWQKGDCGTQCQEWVSSCMLAHINLTGKHVPFYADAAHPSLGWGTEAEYPRQEGVYFGNLFAEHPLAYACKGRDANLNPIPGRLCLGQEGCPYVDAAPGARCADVCTERKEHDGYTECTVGGKKFTRPVTVWTH